MVAAHGEARELAQRWRSTGGPGCEARRGPENKRHPRGNNPGELGSTRGGSGGAPWGVEAGPQASPTTRAEIQVRLYRSISRLPVRSGRGGENEGHGATRTVGPDSDGEITAGWRAVAGEIEALSRQNHRTTRQQGTLELQIITNFLLHPRVAGPVSYTHLTLPTKA